MKRVVSLIALSAMMVLGFAATLRADDQPAVATGTVSVTVTDANNKPVTGATVRITAPKQAAAKAAKNGQNLAADAPADKPAKGAPVAEGKTDKDGKATLENVPAGSYNLSANLKGSGNAREKIEVKAGETLTVALQLKPRAS